MDELLEILNDLHPEVDFENCDKLLWDDHILDSFDVVSICAEIQEVFDVEIGAEHLTAENFNSAKALYALVEKLMDEED